jgi:general stress protein CsbA
MNQTSSPSGNSPTIPALLLVWLGLMASMTYLTGFGLVPGVANNIGPFELVSALFILGTLAYFLRQNLPVYNHFLGRILILILLLAAMDLLKFSERPFWGVTQWLLLLYGIALLLAFYNWFILYPPLLRYLLRFLAYAAVIAALWVTIDGFLSGGDINASGPFRNRVHVGIYMASSFWFVLVYISYPEVSFRERALLYLCMLLILYGVAVSGRRSVYLALIAGFALLSAGLLYSFRRNYNQIVPVFVLSLGFFALLYFGRGASYLPSTLFFQERVLTIEDRLRAFAGDEDVLSDDENFILLQRQGMWNAVSDHPIMGIGWGAFYDSPYSPTGHEMHSTPQKFLAELGLIGFVMYLVLTAYVLIGSFRLFRQARNSPYELSSMLLMIALWSMHISWAYNRAMTDRTYWLLLVILSGFEIIVLGAPLARKKALSTSLPTPAP